jgi:hypothetical protein
MVMWQASRRGINTRIDQHLDLVTTILARPEMTDFVLAQYSDHSGAITNSLHSVHAIP